MAYYILMRGRGDKKTFELHPPVLLRLYDYRYDK